MFFLVLLLQSDPTVASYPGFSDCYSFQSWWNKADVRQYYLKKWHPRAKRCWSYNLYKFKVTHKGERVDFIDLHDDLVLVYWSAKQDSSIGNNPRVMSVLEHLCAGTMDVIYFYRERESISQLGKSLNEMDYIKLVEAITKYSKRLDIYIFIAKNWSHIQRYFRDVTRNSSLNFEINMIKLQNLLLPKGHKKQVPQ